MSRFVPAAIGVIICVLVGWFVGGIIGENVGKQIAEQVNASEILPERDKLPVSVAADIGRGFGSPAGVLLALVGLALAGLGRPNFWRVLAYSLLAGIFGLGLGLGGHLFSGDKGLIHLQTYLIGGGAVGVAMGFVGMLVGSVVGLARSTRPAEAAVSGPAEGAVCASCGGRISGFLDQVLVLRCASCGAAVHNDVNKCICYDSLDSSRIYCRRCSVEIEQARIEAYRKPRLTAARQLEQAYRFEDAAKIYEELEMYEEAGRVRRMDRMVEGKVKLTSISLDLNNLLDQMRKGGLTVVYSCPSCRAPLKISGDTRPSSLQSCEYCGSSIETTTLAEFLQRALS